MSKWRQDKNTYLYLKQLIKHRLAIIADCQFCGHPGYIYYSEPYPKDYDVEGEKKRAACTSCLDKQEKKQ